MRRQPVVGNCDWLAWSVRGLDPTKLPEKDCAADVAGRQVRLVVGAGTASYSRRVMVFNEYGDKLATLICQPKSKLFAPDTGIVEVANEWLYHGIGWNGVWGIVCGLFPCVRTGLSRWDFCFDFTPNRRQRCIIGMLADGRAYVAAKRNGTNWWSIDNSEGCPEIYRGVRIPHCISWGHKTTAVRWKLYYKSKELGEPSGWKGWEKPYIVDQWRANGLDERNVWRVEVSLHHGNGFSINDVGKIPVEASRDDMERLARSLMSSRWVIRRNQGHKDKRNDRELLLWENWPYDAVRTRRGESERMNDARHALLRRLIECTSNPDFATSRTLLAGVVTMAQQLIDHDHLGEYAKAMVGMEWGDYCQSLELPTTDAHHYQPNPSADREIFAKFADRFDSANLPTAGKGSQSSISFE